MLTLKAPAKINWFLLVLGRRPDGYHDIQSLMQCVSLYDYLTFEDSDTIEIITDADIPLEENLIYKTAVRLKEQSGVEKGARITLKKHIPLAAGLGGGSSDAACTLKGLTTLWKLNIPEAKLLEIAGTIGSDVPFFLKGHSALVEGRGEKVTPVSLKRSFIMVLVKPPVGVSAKWAYSGIKELTKKANNIELFIQALEAGDFPSIKSMAKNDLENPVLRRYPVVNELKGKLLDCGALLAAMSGSGPTVFGVFENRTEAEKAVDAVSPQWAKIVETLL
jgi:4-diphosphocytidyl-2-C-methyl-D-erythritol kinase